MHQRLWPSTFVLETNLAGLIAEIRRALEDTAEKPTFVRTMHRFGYRFIGDVNDPDALLQGLTAFEAPLGVRPRSVNALLDNGVLQRERFNTEKRSNRE